MVEGVFGIGKMILLLFVVKVWKDIGYCVVGMVIVWCVVYVLWDDFKIEFCVMVLWFIRV